MLQKLLFSLTISFSIGTLLADIKETLQVYPKELSVGDTLYVRIDCENTGNVPITVEYAYTELFPKQKTQYYIEDGDSKWNVAFLLEKFGYIGDAFSHKERTTIAPHSKKVALLLSVPFPALDDLHEPFWNEVLKKITQKNKVLDFKIKKQYVKPTDGTIEVQSMIIGTQVTVKPRPLNDMKILEAFYQSVPDFEFPRYEESDFGMRKISGEFYLKMSKNESDFVRPGQENRKVSLETIRKEQLYPEDFFLTLPNVKSPDTRQGWKELEESLTPSTMRDEIRLTRMLIQYCDTEDAKVLEELKEWFANMNEIQRTVMAKSILDRARSCYGNDELLNPYRTLYHTIRKYDISPKSSWDEKHLKNLRLLE